MSTPPPPPPSPDVPLTAPTPDGFNSGDDGRVQPQWAWAGLIGLIASLVVSLVMLIILAVVWGLLGIVIFGALDKGSANGLLVVVALLGAAAALALYFYLLPLLTAKMFDWRNFSYRSRWNFLPAYFIASLAAGIVSNLISVLMGSAIEGAVNGDGSAAAVVILVLVSIIISLAVSFVVTGFCLVWTSQWSKTAGQIVSIIGIVVYSLFLFGVIASLLLITSFISGAKGTKTDDSTPISLQDQANEATAKADLRSAASRVAAAVSSGQTVEEATVSSNLGDRVVYNQATGQLQSGSCIAIVNQTTGVIGSIDCN